MEGPRACRTSEFDEVIELINATFRADGDQDIKTDYPLVFNDEKLDYMRILKVDGKVVSHVPVASRQVVAKDDAFTIGIISPTITHPDYRKRGYATLCLRDCVRIMKEEGWPVSVLWTLEATFPFYQQSGWEAVGSQGWVYALSPPDEATFDSGAFEFVAFDPKDDSHLETVVAIHDAEQHHIVRSHDDYRALLTLPKIRPFLARGDGEAYLVYGEASNKPGIIEGGGDPKALDALMRYLVREVVTGDIQAWAPISRSTLGDVLEDKKPGTARPVEQSKGAGHQMMRVNSLEKLVGSIKHHLAERAAGLNGQVSLVCVETDECVSMRFGNGTVDVTLEPGSDPIVLSQRQLTQLIFGSYAGLEPLSIDGGACEILGKLFPFYFPIWGLDHS